MRLFKSFSHILLQKEAMRPSTLLILISLFFVLFCNFRFFENVFAVFPPTGRNLIFLFSLGGGIAAILVLFLSLISTRYTLKPILYILLLITPFTAYFMDDYNVVIDREMIRNVLQTNWAEAADLLNWKIIWYFLFLGILPGLFVYRVRLVHPPFKKAVLYKIATCFVSVVVVALMVFSSSKYYVSFFREHKPLRYYTNPSYYLYSVGDLVAKSLSSGKKEIVQVGTDAKVVQEAGAGPERPKLIILVVGEAARADHFSLNGYGRETNPLLAKENIINYSKMYSCGTSTAYSVPCMFSQFTRNDYSPKKGRGFENILDVLQRTGSIKVLWRDNNSDSKGVALRVPYEDFSKADKNPTCEDGECRDVGMLSGLDAYITGSKNKDLLIVLHQMGNHGPAYYKRYPKEFARYQPVCATNQLEKCSEKEITNAYDNALLYTDYFLSQVIAFLKRYDPSYDTALMYFSDHGESLGENGVYLHGLPYAFAPDSQKHIGSFMWFGEEMKKKLNLATMKAQQNEEQSQDSIFHTLLGIFNVETKLYNSQLDLIAKPANNDSVVQDVQVSSK